MGPPGLGTLSWAGYILVGFPYRWLIVIPILTRQYHPVIQTTRAVFHCLGWISPWLRENAGGEWWWSAISLMTSLKNLTFLDLEVLSDCLDPCNLMGFITAIKIHGIENRWLAMINKNTHEKRHACGPPNHKDRKFPWMLREWCFTVGLRTTKEVGTFCRQRSRQQRGGKTIWSMLQEISVQKVVHIYINSGFKCSNYFLCSPLFGDMIEADSFFLEWVATTKLAACCWVHRMNPKHEMSDVDPRTYMIPQPMTRSMGLVYLRTSPNCR